MVFYCAIQTTRHPQTFYVFSHEALNGYFCITPHFNGLCEGWYSKLFCDSFFLLQRYYITASFLKTAISFPATNTRILYVYMVSRNVVLVSRVNNKPLALNSNIYNVENQYIIRLCTNYCYCINIGSDMGPPILFCTDTDIGKNYHIGGQYFSQSNYRYTSTLESVIDSWGRKLSVFFVVTGLTAEVLLLPVLHL